LRRREIRLRHARLLAPAPGIWTRACQQAARDDDRRAAPRLFPGGPAGPDI